MSDDRSAIRGQCELQLELGYLLSNVAGWGAHLSGDAPHGHRLDARNRAQRVVPGARHGIVGRRHSHHAQSLAHPARQRLCGSVPLLVQMFLWYFVLPELLPTELGDWLKQLPDASFYTAVVSLGFYTSARVAEQVRAGILSLARGQGWAALALGLTQPQAYIYVLLPMAYRVI